MYVSAHRSGSYAYIVESEAALRGITVEFQLGLCRLVPLPHTSLLHLWDKPCPPKPDNCALFGPALSPLVWFRQMRTINPRDCTGITFFIGLSTYSIHGHSSLDPTAESTFQRLSQSDNKLLSGRTCPCPPTTALRPLVSALCRLTGATRGVPRVIWYACLPFPRDETPSLTVLASHSALW